MTAISRIVEFPETRSTTRPLRLSLEAYFVRKACEFASDFEGGVKSCWRSSRWLNAKQAFSA